MGNLTIDKSSHQSKNGHLFRSKLRHQRSRYSPLIVSSFYKFTNLSNFKITNRSSSSLSNGQRH